MAVASSLSKLLSSLRLQPPPPSHELSLPPRVLIPPKKNPNPSPLVANSNMFFFRSSAGFNAQVTVKDNNEPEEWLLNRFRREVIRAGVFRECKKRRFFENNQDKKKRAGAISKKKKKRKARQAARRNKNNSQSQRSPQSRYGKQFKQQKPEKKDSEPKRQEDSENDNWDIYEVDLPYN